MKTMTRTGTSVDRRAAGDLQSTVQTLTRSEYEKRTRNLVPVEPIRGTEGPPPVERQADDLFTPEELVDMMPATQRAGMAAAVKQLRDAGFDDRAVVRLLIGTDADAPEFRRESTDKQLLRFLREHGGEYLSHDGRCVSELAHRLGVSVSTFTQALKRLAKSGAVVRTYSNAGTTRVALP